MNLMSTVCTQQLRIVHSFERPNYFKVRRYSAAVAMNFFSALCTVPHSAFIKRNIRLHFNAQDFEQKCPLYSSYIKQVVRCR